MSTDSETVSVSFYLIHFIFHSIFREYFWNWVWIEFVDWFQIDWLAEVKENLCESFISSNCSSSCYTMAKTVISLTVALVISVNCINGAPLQVNVSRYVYYTIHRTERSMLTSYEIDTVILNPIFISFSPLKTTIRNDRVIDSLVQVSKDGIRISKYKVG